MPKFPEFPPKDCYQLPGIRNACFNQISHAQSLVSRKVVTSSLKNVLFRGVFRNKVERRRKVGGHHDNVNV